MGLFGNFAHGLLFENVLVDLRLLDVEELLPPHSRTPSGFPSTRPCIPARISYICAAFCLTRRAGALSGHSASTFPSFKPRDSDNTGAGETHCVSFRECVGKIDLVCDNNDWQVPALDDSDHHNVDLHKRIERRVEHIDNAVDILAKPVHDFGDSLSCLSGPDDGFILFHPEFEELMVVDLSCDSRGINNVDCDSVSVCSGDDDVFFLPCTACLVGDLAYRADSISCPVAGDTVCKRSLPCVWRAINSYPVLFFLKKRLRKSENFFFTVP